MTPRNKDNPKNEDNLENKENENIPNQKEHFIGCAN